MSVKKNKAISVLSGGLDSTVATFLCIENYEIHAVIFDYGQKAVKQEIISAKKICNDLGFEYTIVDLNWLNDISTSALNLDSIDIPKLDENKLDDNSICENSANKVWVPARNLVFTSVAVSFAESFNAKHIIVGWDKEESVTFPDNSKNFLNSFNKTISIGSSYDIKIIAPLIDLNKKEIIELGSKIKVPMNLTYSCYLGEDLHCGVCESCIRRKRGFKLSNILDNTNYKE